MNVILEFVYMNETISLYIEKSILFEDRAFSFYQNGNKFNFKVKWDRSEIEIFLTDETQPIYYIGNFNVYYNKNLK